jgi:hypothetical protein
MYMSTGLVWGGNAEGVLLVVSRETGSHLSARQVLYESLILGLRYLYIKQGPPVRELWAFHIKHHSSLRHVPARPRGATAQKWAHFHTLLARQAIGTTVEFLIRGIDGLTTAHTGLVELIKQYRHLFLKFTIIQRRCTIGPRLRQFLMHWFAFSPPAVTAWMRTLVFPTFTAQRYMIALNRPAQPLHLFFIHDLLLVWHYISHGKSSGDASWYNNNRNSFV